MQEFVIGISTYCKSIQPNFTIVPQNGIQLAYLDAEPENNLHEAYLASIDGFGVEGLFYNEKYNPDSYRINMVNTLKGNHPFFVADFNKKEDKTGDMFAKCDDLGVVAFPRNPANFDYKEIPTYVHHENTNPIVQLSDAQNYLYLISTDNFSTKEDYLNAIRATNFDVVIIDLFFNELELTASEVASLKTKANGAPRLVICYMNIGSAEKYRYYWQSNWKLHKPSWLKQRYPGYSDEIYVEYWNEHWQSIIFGNDQSYAKKILNAGFDGAYLDNVEAYYYLR